MNTANRIVGQRVYFAREGDAYTVPSAGTVSRTAKPGDGDAAWIEFGDVDELSIVPEGAEKEVWAPGDGGVQQLKNIIINRPKTMIEFRTQELSAAGYEMLLRTAELTSASTTHTPHASIQKKGVLRIVQSEQDPDADPINTLYFYGSLVVPTGVPFGEDVVRIPFKFTMLTSTLNGGTLDA